MRFEIVSGDGRAAGQVTENDLETVVILSNQIDHKRRLLAQVADSVLDRLAHGSDIEPGAHDARREVVRDGGVTEERLVVDGVVRHRRLTGGGHHLKRRR